MSDANEVEEPVSSSSPVEANDGELTSEDLSVHSSPAASVSSCFNFRLHFNPNRSKHSIVFNIIILGMFLGDLIIQGA